MRPSMFMFIVSVMMFMIGGYGAIGTLSVNETGLWLGILAVLQAIIWGIDIAIQPRKSKNDEYFEAMREGNHD